MGCKPTKDMAKKVVEPAEEEAPPPPDHEISAKPNRKNHFSKQTAQDNGIETHVLASPQKEEQKQAPVEVPESKRQEKKEEDEEEEQEKAALAIQTAFRRYHSKKEVNDKMASDHPTKEQLEAEFRSDDKELCSAATKIQASFRGHQARKTTGEVASNNAKVDELSEDMQKMTQEEEELDIDLTDPELHKAATKIQASFRGHKVRKEDPK